MTLLDSRFDEEWLATHDVDRMLVEGMASRSVAEPGTERARGEREQMEARKGHDVWDRLPRITCPTLVASGRYDGIAPPANGEAIASQIPNADFRVYEGGHAFFAQDPTAFPEILAFLCRLTAPKVAQIVRIRHVVSHLRGGARPGASPGS